MPVVVTFPPRVVEPVPVIDSEASAVVAPTASPNVVVAEPFVIVSEPGPSTVVANVIALLA